ncbi:adenylate kinase [soil metagenome]
MRFNLVLMGPPGCGKGTQAIRLARRFSIPHISTGDILRQAVRDGSPLGREVGALLATGALVSDTLITSLVQDRLTKPDVSHGFILDGFPRTLAQAQRLGGMLPDDAPLVVALIAVPEEEIVRRLSSRRLCESCRITQSVSDASDPDSESCPYCGGRLVRREDDEASTVRRRLATYAAEAEPVISYYRQRQGFVGIDGLQPPERVTTALFAEIARQTT